MHGYEVCDESPLYDGDYFHVCVAVLYQPSNMSEIRYKGCFIVEYNCYDTCVLDEEYSKDYYSCCCNSTLCNSDIYNNDSLIISSNNTSVTKPTGKQFITIYRYYLTRI